MEREEKKRRGEKKAERKKLQWWRAENGLQRSRQCEADTHVSKRESATAVMKEEKGRRRAEKTPLIAFFRLPSHAEGKDVERDGCKVAKGSDSGVDAEIAEEEARGESKRGKTAQSQNEGREERTEPGMAERRRLASKRGSRQHNVQAQGQAADTKARVAATKASGKGGVQQSVLAAACCPLKQ